MTVCFWRVLHLPPLRIQRLAMEEFYIRSSATDTASCAGCLVCFLVHLQVQADVYCDVLLDNCCLCVLGRRAAWRGSSRKEYDVAC